jgi:hypothetical protein
MIKQPCPDFLYTWRHDTLERQAYTPEGDNAHLSRATVPVVASETEALYRWLAAGGDLADAALYGLEIVVDDETIDQRMGSSPRFVANLNKRY